MNGLNPPPPPQAAPPTHHTGAPHHMTNHGPITETFSVPDQLVGLIIGKNGEQINRIQQETGCRVQIVPQPNGTPDRPCTLIGNPHQVMGAKAKLQEIILRGGPRENNQYGNGDNNPMSPYGNSAGDYQDYQITIEMMIPPDKCGLIIGKGGNTLKTMMQEHSVKLHLVQDSAEITKDEKPLKIIGTRQQVEDAKRAVQVLMSQKDGNKGLISPLGKPTIEVSVPKAAVGVVIGRGGENISRIQSETNTRIQFKPDDPNQDTRGCVISGTAEACNAAQEKIKEIAAQKLAEQGQSGPSNTMFGMGSQTVEFPVPANRAGVVIGKGGENIRLIKEKSGAFVQIEKSVVDNGDKDPAWKTFIIRGTPMQIEEAQRLIQEKAGVAPPTNNVNPMHGQYHHGDGPATPLGTPGTPIQHAHTPITSMIGQMGNMSIQPGTPGTPGPPHPSQQQINMWNTPEHSTGADSQISQWYQPTPQMNQYQSHYQGLQWTNSQPLHQSQQGRQPPHNQNADYSRQWHEYWKQMNDSQHQQYSAHGQVMSQHSNASSAHTGGAAGGGGGAGGAGGEQTPWRGDQGYQMSYPSHSYPSYPSYPTQDNGLIYAQQDYQAKLAIDNLDNDPSPINTSRYSPQSQ